MWDWTGNEQKERGGIWVVALTRDRVVEWRGTQSQRKGEDNRLHPNIKEVSLEGVDVECTWLCLGFRVALVNSETRQCLYCFHTPDWNGYAPALRLVVARLRKKPHWAVGWITQNFVRILFPYLPKTGSSQ